MLNIPDGFLRECPTTGSRRNPSSDDVINVLTELYAPPGVLAVAKWENGPEFVAEAARKSI